MNHACFFLSNGVIASDLYFPFVVSEILHLNNNAFSGIIPSEIGLLTSVRELQLHTNRLSGGIPEDFSSLSDLGMLLFL
jgi:hypothetical protein